MTDEKLEHLKSLQEKICILKNIVQGKQNKSVIFTYLKYCYGDEFVKHVHGEKVVFFQDFPELEDVMMDYFKSKLKELEKEYEIL